MNKDKKPFCVWFTLFMFTTGLLGQLLFLPSSGWCSTGDNSLTGARLVKTRLDHMGQAAKPAKPGTKVYVIQSGDIFCDILEKTGVSKKDALYISRKADRVYKLRKMRPGTALELYFSPEGTGLQEVDYNVSPLKKVVLYNGKVISLVQGTSRSGYTPPSQDSLRPKGNPAVIADRPPNTPVDQLPTVKTPSKNSVSGCPEQQLKTDRNAAKICMPPSIIEPGSDDRMKLYSSYNCGLPRNIQNDEEARYDLLANGQVLLPELLIPDSDTLKLGMGKKPANTVVKKSHKNTVAKKKSKVRIAAREQTQFLKAPLAYRRVSSGFSYNRLNPITNVEQPHLGIDYSAPSGTPVHSIGPGKVLFYGWDGGYGKIIRILHNNGYISQYAHLCRFARGIMTGKRIRRGETVGYVGMTGLATGPHLDFRVTHRGIFINPMKVEGSSWKISSKYETGKVHKAARG